MGMRIVVGHANPDFDAYASTVAATKLYPGARGVFLGTQNANVRAFHNLHEELLDFTDLRGLDLGQVDSIVMVDTRDPDRVSEIGPLLGRPDLEVIVYDHHPRQEGDIEGAEEHWADVGATTSILVHEIKQRDIELTPVEASVLLLGIHEDTGSLTYPNATAYDADAAAYLMAVGADMEVLNQFLSRKLDASQRDLLAQLQDSLEIWDINGQQVAVGVASADEYVDSASVLTHYIVEDLGYHVAIAIVAMPQRVQLVARSRLTEVDVGAVMTRLGGGGHEQAASAGFRHLEIADAKARIREALEAVVTRPLRACDIMSTPVRTIPPSATMAAAGELMARWGHGGLPVMEAGRLVGLVTRKDVDKALGHGLAHAPVTGFMTRDVVTVPADKNLPEMESLLATRGIGRVPVVDAGRMVGIVTRKDVLRAEHGESYLDHRSVDSHPEARKRFLEGVESLLPAEVVSALHAAGAVAGRRNERAHVVGGFVRDMMLGRKNLDIDIVVEGDGVDFAGELSALLGGRVKAHLRFGTAVIVLARDLHIDVASSRAEYYTKPGALPTVERSQLRQDLFRRDFTVNAMAASLAPECFGRISDPFGGLRDLDSGVIRVMHALSFIDDPTRVLRAARFECRYGFAIDATTDGLVRQAVALSALGEVSGARVREELLDIFDEDDPLAVLARLDELGALAALAPEGADARTVLGDAAAAQLGREALATVVDRPLRPRIVLAAAMASAGSQAGCERWLRHFRFGREYSDVALPLSLRSSAALTLLRDRRGVRDSRLYRALSALPAEALAVLWGRGDALGRERILRFASDLAHTGPAVSGRDLLDMGYAPSAQFTAILGRALDDRLDGRVIGRDAELANLRRIARKALGTPPG